MESRPIPIFSKHGPSINRIRQSRSDWHAHFSILTARQTLFISFNPSPRNWRTYRLPSRTRADLYETRESRVKRSVNNWLPCRQSPKIHSASRIRRLMRIKWICLFLCSIVCVKAECVPEEVFSQVNDLLQGHRYDEAARTLDKLRACETVFTPSAF